MLPTDKIMQAIQPRLNADICEGLASQTLKGIDEYVNGVMRNAAGDLFCEGLRYDGCHICSPHEMMAKAASLPSRQGKIALEKSDTYMICLRFSFRAHKNAEYRPIESQYMMLPYVSRGGTMMIRGVRYVINPAIVDNVFTIEDNNVFIPFTRSRDNFSSVVSHYYANGERQDVKIVWGHLHRDKNKQILNKQYLPTLVNYIFCYIGVTEAFRRYCKTDVIYGSDDITTQKYPPSEWVIFESAGNPRNARGKRTRGAGNDRVSHNPKSSARLVIRKEDLNKPGLKAMVGGLFYTLDWVSEYPFANATEELDNITFWRRCLLRFIFKDVSHEKKFIASIDTHLDSVSCYVDRIVKQKLAAEGIIADTTMDLFAFLNAEFTNITSRADPSSVEGKVLEVNRFVMHLIILNIFKMGYELNRLTGTRLTEARVVQAIRSYLGPDTILRINHDHGVVRSAESATDNMLMNLTLPVVTQSVATGGRGGHQRKDAETNQPITWLHPTLPWAHSILAIKKSVPSGRGLLNPFANLSPTHGILPMPGTEAHIDNLRELLIKTLD